VRLQAALGCPWDLLLTGLNDAGSVEMWLEQMKADSNGEWNEWLRAMRLAWVISHGHEK
jgi:hypothetical protein